jgi:hypothetical protein
MRNQLFCRLYIRENEMNDLPDWLPKGLSHAKYDEPGDRIRIRGSNFYPGLAQLDLLSVLQTPAPEGYQFSKCRADVEHKNSRRLSWSVTWIRTSVAEAHWHRKQATRMSRFIHHEEPA